MNIQKNNAIIFLSELTKLKTMKGAADMGDFNLSDFFHYLKVFFDELFEVLEKMFNK